MAAGGSGRCGAARRKRRPRRVGAVDARLSPDDHTLFVDESKVGAFAVTGGNLTELASSPTLLPADATPAGIAVN